METEVKSLTVNGVEYVRKDCIENVPAAKLDGMEYCIVRTYSAGVFAGYIESRNGREVVLRKVRRLWYWDGASELSQLSQEGVNKPQNCKFAMEVDKIIVLEAIEILPCSEKAIENIKGVKEWKQ